MSAIQNIDDINEAVLITRVIFGTNHLSIVIENRGLQRSFVRTV